MEEVWIFRKLKRERERERERRPVYTKTSSIFLGSRHPRPYLRNYIDLLFNSSPQPLPIARGITTAARQRHQPQVWCGHPLAWTNGHSATSHQRPEQLPGGRQGGDAVDFLPFAKTALLQLRGNNGREVLQNPLKLQSFTWAMKIAAFWSLSLQRIQVGVNTLSSSPSPRHDHP